MPLKKLYLELTEQCNLECSMCFRHQWSLPPMDMLPEVWEKMMKEINDMPDLETLVLGGMGEPILSPVFERTLELLGHKQLWVTTNGTMFKEKLKPQWLEYIDLFIVSLDGVEEDMIQGRGVKFDELIENIDFLNALRKENPNTTCRLDIQFVASKKNIESIFPLMDVLAHKNVRNLVVSHIMPQDASQSNDIMYGRYAPEGVKKLFAKIRNYSFRRGLRVKLPEIELKTERQCEFVAQSATYVTAGGLVVPCYRLSHDGKEVALGREKTIKAFGFGNLHENSLYEIWKSSAYVNFRNKIFNHQYPSCPDCDWVEGCALIQNTDFDCFGDAPSCADCLWSRKFVFCN